MTVIRECKLGAEACLDVLDVAVAVISRDGPYSEPILDYANSVFEALTGRPASALTGRGITDLRDRFGWQYRGDEAWKAIEAGRPWTGRLVLIRPDDESAAFNCSIRPVPAGSGARASFLMTLQGEQGSVGERQGPPHLHLQQLADVSLDAIILVDQDQIITSFNPGAERTFQWRAAEIVGRPVDVLIPETYRLGHARHVEAFRHGAQETQQMNSRRYIQGLRRDGTVFPAEATITKLTVGSTLHFGIILRDITARHAQAKALEESERRFRVLFNEAEQLIVLLSPGGEILQANASAVAFCGFDPEETEERQLKDSPAFEGLPDSLVRILGAVRDAARGEVVRGFVEMRSGARRLRTFDYSVKPVGDPEGRVLSLLFEARDVTRLVEANDAVVKSETLLRNAQAMGKMGHWGLDTATGELHWSDEVYRIFGRSRGDFVPSFEVVMEAVHPDDRPMVEEAVASALANRSAYAVDHRILLPDGSERSVHAEAEVVFGSEGGAPRMEGVVQDVTDTRRLLGELARAKRDAERASEAKTRFVANMSHELRTPLNAIVGFSDLLAEAAHGPLGTPQYADYAQAIVQSAMHLNTIIENILEVARLDKQAISDTEMPLADALEETVERFLCISGEDRERIIVHTPPALALRADRRLFGTMLYSLLENSSKFSHPSTPIEVSVCRGADWLEIEVRDQGAGIPADMLERVTEPFFQVESDLDRRYEGAGLGLHLVKKSIRMHDGELVLRSEPGVGTTAVLRFPASRARSV